MCLVNSMTSDIYKKAVAENFFFLKTANNIQEAYLRAIPIDNIGFLLPVCEAIKDDELVIQNITDWRNQNVAVYPTQFIATFDSTKIWLIDQVLGIEDRVLFLVVDNQGNSIGHMGFNGCINNELFFEVDNVVRGKGGGEKGLFSLALKAMLEWARTLLNVNGFFLRVMEENYHAIKFYKNNGFHIDRYIPLFREENEKFVAYREVICNELAVKYFVRMIWQPPKNEIGDTLILTSGPSVSARETVYVYHAAHRGWNKDSSKYLTSFEKKFAEYIGVRYALATSSCTGALQIALMALGVGEGDEVIVPDETWVATGRAVSYVGAQPIFADIELDTWNLDAQSVESLITSKTKAIIPVHMYGNPARMTNIVKVAEKYGLKIVEDAAPAIGAEWLGKRCGSFGDFAAFSFQGAKLLVTGEGGMLVTNDERLYLKALKIWDQGRNPSRTFWIDECGVKYKMSNLQAAFGLAQISRADELIEMKRKIFSWYEEGLVDCPHITLNKEVPGGRSVYWMSSIFLNDSSPVDRDQLIKILLERNIDTRPVFPAISQYPIWCERQHPKPNALLVGQRAMNLPSGVCLSKEHIHYVCENINNILSASLNGY